MGHQSDSMGGGADSSPGLTASVPIESLGVSTGKGLAVACVMHMAQLFDGINLASFNFGSTLRVRRLLLPVRGLIPNGHADKCLRNGS